MKESQPPAPLPHCLAILILRVLHFTQDEVIEELHCAKLTVGEVERWFKELPLQEAEILCGDPYLRDKANKLLYKTGVESAIIDIPTAIRVGNLSKEDILSHYKATEYLESKAREKVDVDPTVQRAQEEHLNNEVRAFIKGLRGGLKTPRINEIVPGYTVKNPPESDPVWACLRGHIRSTFAWEQLDLWKEQMNVYLKTPRDRKEELDRLYAHLIDLEKIIKQSLTEILIQRDYVRHTCNLCPIKKVSSR